MASLCAAAILVGVHGAAATRDRQDSGTVQIAADGCAHCPEDIPSPER
jgi:hypothetical protein